MSKLIKILPILLLLTACGMDIKLTKNLALSGPEVDQVPGVSLIVAGNPTLIELNEGGDLVIVPSLSAAVSTDVEVTLMVSSPRGDVPVFFPHSFPLTVTIAAGQTSAILNLNSSINPSYTGDLPFVVTLSSSQLSDSVNFNLKIKDLQPLTLGTFSINGIEDGVGTIDVTSDAALIDSLTPKIKWGASSFAEEYLVTILEDDQTTIKCAQFSTTDLEYNYSAGNCSLTVGNYYRARVISKSGTTELTASLFRFQVQSTAILNPDSIMLMANGSAVTFDPRVNDVNPTGVITSVSTPSSGTASTNGSTVTYTPAGSTNGLVTFTYTVLDGNGNPVPGTVNVKLMTAYTWTGAVSTNFATSGNWCSSVTNPGPTGTCSGGAAPGSSHTAIIDATCSGLNCNPVIANGTTVSISGIRLNANTLTKSGTAVLNLTSGGFIQNGGSFVGGTGNMTITSGNFTLNGGVFTAPSGTLKIHRFPVNIGNSATFNHGNGTIQFSSDWNSNQTITTRNAVLNNVNFNSEGGDNISTISGTMTVSGNMVVSDVAGQGIMNGGTIKLAGDLTLVGKGVFDGTTVVELTGRSSGQTVSGNAGGGITGLRLATGTNPVTFAGEFAVHTGSLEVVSTGLFSAAGNTLIFGDGGCGEVKVIPGNLEYNNVRLGPGCQTYSLENGTMKIAGNFTLANTDYASTLNNGTWQVKGNIDASTSLGYNGSGKVKLMGNSAGQTITGGPNAMIPRIELDTGTHAVTMSGKLAIFGEYKVTSVGTLTTGNLIFDGGCAGYGTGEFSAQMGTYLYPQLTLAGGCAIFNLNGQTARVGDLKLGRAGNADDERGHLNSGTFEVAGNLDINTVLGFDGSGVIKLVGNGVGQTITSNSANSQIPSLIIDADTTPVTLGGAQVLKIRNDYTYLTSGAFSALGKTMKFTSDNCEPGVNLRMGSVTYGNLIFDTFCRTINISDSIYVAGNFSILDTGTFNMPNPGAGYSINVGGTFSNPSAVLNLNGATLNN